MISSLNRDTTTANRHPAAWRLPCISMCRTGPGRRSRGEGGPLLSLERGLPLVEKRAGSLAHVGSREGESEQRGFEEGASANGTSLPRWTASRMYRVGDRRLCRQFVARARARSSRSAAGTTRLTRPIRMRFVGGHMTTGQQQLERHAFADQPGQPLRPGKPRRNPRGSPPAARACAVSAASRSVHAIASSHPPPSANPLMAAITGLPRCSMASKTRWPSSACSCAWPASAPPAR